MNWDAIGAVSESIGAAGVIASLIYVALQMKVSNTASAVEAKLRMTEQMASFNYAFIHNPRLYEVMIKGRRGLENLDKQESVEFANLALTAIWYMSSSYFTFRAGSISEDDYHEQLTIVDYWASGPGFRQWWEKQGAHNFEGTFKRHMEERIRLAESRSG